MDQVRCQLEIPNVEGLNPGEITVGRHVFLKCEGEWTKTFDFARAEIKVEETQKYVIKVLKAEARDASSFDVDFTLYSAGKMQFPQMILTDGTNEISLGQQQFQVISVIEKPAGGQQPAQQPKPYGMIFPLNLSWPALYFILLASVIVLFLVGLVFQLRRAARYKRLIDDLKNYHSAIDPDLQFYKSIRLAEKKQYPLDEIEKAFRLFVLRVYQIPMFTLDNRQIIRFFKKRKPFLKNERLFLQKLLSEFEEIHTHSTELQDPEKLELVTKLYRFVDQAAL
jgi:hypothetical protein